jgi:HSP20 family protein
VIKEILEVRQRLNDALDALLAERAVGVGEPHAGPVAPPADMYETEDGFVIVIELPGTPPADIDLQLQGDRLRVSGRRGPPEDSGDVLQIECQRGAFFRDFTLPTPRIDGSPHARLEHGVLTIWLGKAQPKRARKVPVTQQEGI